MPARDINNYQRLYDRLPFEETMAEIRKKTVVNFLIENHAKKIIEAGCGNSSVFNHYRQFDRIIVTEPAEVFYSKLKEDAALLKDKNIIVIHAPFTASAFENIDTSKTDAIVISGLLHEIPEPAKMLRDALLLCDDNTRVHINVPGANSLHRIMALEMGLISGLRQKSITQEQLQQYHTFDMEGLKALAVSSGFSVLEEGSLFIKPFTHLQMQCLLEHPLFGEKIIAGFEKLIKYLPAFGAEIYLNLRKA